MKKIIISILFIFCAIYGSAQDEIINPGDYYEAYYDSAWINEKAGITGYGPYGEVFTPKGSIRVLIIFARFSNDNNQVIGNWPTTQDHPAWVNSSNSSVPDLVFRNLSDFSLYEGTVNRNISEFYYEMSMGSFIFLGDILSLVAENYFRFINF